MSFKAIVYLCSDHYDKLDFSHHGKYDWLGWAGMQCTVADCFKNANYGITVILQERL